MKPVQFKGSLPRILSLCCLLFAFLGAFGWQLQGDKLDAAKKLIAQTDSLYRITQFDSALVVSSQALSACEAAGHLEGIPIVLNIVGNVYRIRGDYAKALTHFKLSLEHFQNLKNQKGTASTLNYIGNVYRLQGNYPGALKFLFNSLQIYQLMNDLPGRAKVYNNDYSMLYLNSFL